MISILVISKANINAKLSNKWSAGLMLMPLFNKNKVGDNSILSAYRMSPITDAYANGKLAATSNHLEGDVIVVQKKQPKS